jgi:rod shape-determining protein MreC
MPLALRVKKKPWLLVGLLLAQLLLISMQVPVGAKVSLLNRVVFSVLAPIQHGLASALGGLRGLWAHYGYLRRVQSQNQELNRELFVLREENRFLREWLGRLNSERNIREAAGRWREDLEIASVIGLDATNVFRSAVIDRGSVHGLRKDMPVLDRNGSLIGRVFGPVAAREAHIQLITDSECGVSVLAGSPAAVGILRGRGDGTCEIRYILDSGPALAPGDEILRSGLDGLYPPGLRVGTVLSVKKDATLFQKIRVKPDFELAGLGRVAILKRPAREFYGGDAR